jgi:hypothetical protein
MDIVLDAVKKIRSLKPPTERNKRCLFIVISFLCLVFACFIGLVNNAVTYSLLWTDDLLLHSAEAKISLPLFNATNLSSYHFLPFYVLRFYLTLLYDCLHF